MKITAITVQARNKNRVNVAVDGRYRFSLEIAQMVELGLKTGAEFTEDELVALEEESMYGKVYARALEYCFVRPRSAREVREYLYRKTRPRRQKDGTVKPGISTGLAERVFDRLVEKNHIDDVRFTNFWVENRRTRQGSSARKLAAELQQKGVDRALIDTALSDTERSDDTEIQKVIAKKARLYNDPKKLMAYLARQGFSYDDIKVALETRESSESD